MKICSRQRYFQLMSFNHSTKSAGIIGISFRFSLTCMYVVCFQYKKENHPKLFQICSYGIFVSRLKDKFQTAVGNEASVFEPLKFYCIFREKAMSASHLLIDYIVRSWWGAHKSDVEMSCLISTERMHKIFVHPFNYTMMA